MKHSIYLIFLVFLVSCASKPVLYPNSKLKEVGKEAAQKDVDACMALADEYLENTKLKEVGKTAGKGAVIGAVTGAVSGIFNGNIGEKALEGAAIGGAIGGTSEALSDDEIKQRFVNRCLSEEGYQVIGWE